MALALQQALGMQPGLSTLTGTSSLFAIVSAVALFAGCAVRSFGASDANLEHARGSAAIGAGLFESQCASCHGEHGEGRGNVPAIMGPGALRRQPLVDPLTQSAYSSTDGQRGAVHPPAPEQGRPEFVSAASLEAYLVFHMPKIKRQPLTEEDYWALVQFMLIAHGSEVPQEGISADNGARVVINAPE